MDHLTRRGLLRSGLGLATAAALRPATATATPPAATATADWAAVRAQFSLAPGWAHMSTFFLVSHPRPVREAIERHRRALDEDPYRTVERHMFEGPEHNLHLAVCRAAAEYLGGKAEEVALTQSTTMGLGIVYQGLPLRPGHEVLLTEHDHVVHHEAARLAAERAGATVRRVALFDKFAELPHLTPEALVAKVRAAIRPETRVVGLTWVHSQSGLKLPLRAMAAAVREANAGRAEADRALLVIDGVHGFGVEDETIAETGVDIFIAGTHKWIFAPRGTGLVWARPATWARLRPILPTFSSEELFVAWMKGEKPPPTPKAAWFIPGGFHAYEHDWAMADAFAWHRALGRKRIADRIHELNEALKQGLSEMKHVTLHTPRGHALSAGLVGFDVASLEPEKAVLRLLEKKVIASASPYRRQVVRLSAGIMTTAWEIETALAAVRGLAA